MVKKISLFFLKNLREARHLGDYQGFNEIFEIYNTILKYCLSGSKENLKEYAMKMFKQCEHCLPCELLADSFGKSNLIETIITPYYDNKEGDQILALDIFFFKKNARIHFYSLGLDLTQSNLYVFRIRSGKRNYPKD